MTNLDYDLIIIGAGSAGYPAGMYASRYKLSNMIIGGQPGGALATSHKVENYPGTLSAPGKEIMDNFRKHAEVSGSELLNEMVIELNKSEDHFHVKTSTGKEFKSKYVILATGNNYRKLGVKGEAEFLGKGVSYCATCDAMFFRNREVIINGGGNTAVTEALYLAELCKKVYLVHRRDTFRAEDIWIEQAKKRDNIEFVLNEEVAEIVGDALGMTGVKLKSGKELKADGIFVAIGNIPNVGLVDHFNPEKDEEGCLVVDARQETSIKGLYAAGDVTTNSNKFRQTIMSAAEGCLAANSVHEDHLR
ncbi:MAG: FAD-dependent oxidoreductase [Candidatus Gracilibacteria bacterium]|nr:FAD-dependent oxidoreductase [Candidatus Gracilibacteria bacterium]